MDKVAKRAIGHYIVCNCKLTDANRQDVTGVEIIPRDSVSGIWGESERIELQPALHELVSSDLVVATTLKEQSGDPVPVRPWPEVVSGHATAGAVAQMNGAERIAVDVRRVEAQSAQCDGLDRQC